MHSSTKSIVSHVVNISLVLFFAFLIATSPSPGVRAETDDDPGKFFSKYPGARESSEISQKLMTFWNAISSGENTEEIEFKTYTTPDPPDNVIDHYKNQEPGNGWDKTLQLPGGGESMVIAWKRNGESLQLVIGEDEGKTFILLGYGKKSSGAKSNWVFYTEEDGLIEDKVTVMDEGKDGSIWFGTFKGLMRFINGTWKAYTFGPLSNGIKDIAVADNGDLWVGTWTKGLMHYGGSVWENITKKDGLVNNRISSIAVGGDGRVWVASFNRKGGVSVFDGTGWVTYSEDSGLPSNYVHSLAVGSKDDIWVGTKEGVAVFRAGEWTSFKTEDGLLDNEIDEIVVDANGNIWAVSDTGVNRFHGASWWTSPYKEDMFGGKVFQLRATPDGRVWFATNNGIKWFDGKSWSSFTEKDGLPDRYILSILVTSGGKVWLGTMNSGIGLSSVADLE